MTDQPTKAALRKACEVLDWPYDTSRNIRAVVALARYFDAEDRAAREALTGDAGWIIRPVTEFTRRHILPDPKPTLADVVERWRITPGRTSEALADMLRDAGLLWEDAP